MPGTIGRGCGDGRSRGSWRPGSSVYIGAALSGRPFTEPTLPEKAAGGASTRKGCFR